MVLDSFGVPKFPPKSQPLPNKWSAKCSATATVASCRLSPASSESFVKNAGALGGACGLQPMEKNMKSG